jgi:hypothetical protein
MGGAVSCSSRSRSAPEQRLQLRAQGTRGVRLVDELVGLVYVRDRLQLLHTDVVCSVFPPVLAPFTGVPSPAGPAASRLRFARRRPRPAEDPCWPCWRTQTTNTRHAKRAFVPRPAHGLSTVGFPSPLPSSLSRAPVRTEAFRRAGPGPRRRPAREKVGRLGMPEAGPTRTGRYASGPDTPQAHAEPPYRSSHIGDLRFPGHPTRPRIIFPRPTASMAPFGRRTRSATPTIDPPAHSESFAAIWGCPRTGPTPQPPSWASPVANPAATTATLNEAPH